VVVFGGRTPPEITGYPIHVNLYRADRESPCGMVARCAHCRRCLDSITVEEVVAAAGRLLDVNSHGAAPSSRADSAADRRPAP
jgi:hypothetical protein